MEPSFGTRLRVHRERQQISLETIAARTKISLSLLEGLEHDDVSRWPVGIFRRSYLRDYARAIGLDPEPIVAEFLALYPEPGPLDPFSAAAAEELDPDGPNTPAGRTLHRLVHSAMSAIPSLLQRAPRFQGSARRSSAAAANPAQRLLDLDADGWEMPRPVKAHQAEAPLESTPPEPAVPPGSVPASVHGRPPAAPLHIASLESEPVLQSRQLPETEPAGQSQPLDRPSLSDAAELCAAFARLQHWDDLLPLLRRAADVLDAVGLVVWSWDCRRGSLAPLFAYGYPDAVVARMPHVRPDADNAIAAAFRSGDASVVDGGSGLTGAMALPLYSTDGCAGVLALELRNGGERRGSVRAFATILASQLAPLVRTVPLAEAVGA